MCIRDRIPRDNLQKLESQDQVLAHHHEDTLEFTEELMVPFCVRNRKCLASPRLELLHRFINSLRCLSQTSAIPILLKKLAFIENPIKIQNGVGIKSFSGANCMETQTNPTRPTILYILYL